MKSIYAIFLLIFGTIFVLPSQAQEHSRARALNEILLEAIRNDFARPVVHARNLFHASAAMYDAWAAYQTEAKPYFLGDTIQGFIIDFEGVAIPQDDAVRKAYQEEAMTYAVYRLIFHRFLFAPGFNTIEASLINMMASYGYDTGITGTDYLNDPRPAILGNYIADQIIRYGLQDGANEAGLYRNRMYQPQNFPLVIKNAGNGELNNPNRWQPIAFDVFIDQAGNVQPSNVPSFLGPEWGSVDPFSLKEEDHREYVDQFGDSWSVYHDPGPPPYLSEAADDEGSEAYKWNFSLVAIWSSMLDPEDGVMWDISPRGIGRNPDLPGDFEGYKDFYKLIDGGDASLGRTLNPVTGEPYEPQIVPRADYARVLAEFWADGPDSETPPGHWFTILNTVMDHHMFSRQWMGQGADLDPLEYDVKAYFTLGGAMHDVAIAAWGIKGWYDYIRPVSAIRYMGSRGQSSNPELPNYDPHGFELREGYIEVIEPGDPLLVQHSDALGKIKLKAWRGPDFIQDPDVDVAGVGWVLADFWWPYQRPTFVTPPFAGYVSGHSTFSRAAAEVMTMMTGDEYFPGGIGIFDAPQNEFLVFEQGPSVDIDLQWATYRDASDQTSLSRIWGGIHPPVDDIPGRIIGIDIGIEAFNYANSYFGQLSSAVSDLPLAQSIYSVFPNPIIMDGLLHIDYMDAGVGGTAEVRAVMVNQSGQLVRSEVVRPGVTPLDLRGLSSGVYFLQLSDGIQRQVESVVIP